MFVAQKLRKQSVSAYLLYMFQVEDVIRAYGLDMDRIRQEYLTRFDYTPEQMKEVTEWYQGLVNMMHEEGCTESGHVQVVRNTIILLNDQHKETLADPKKPFYSAAYYKVLPYIVELRSHGANRDKTEIETCLDALYGVTVLKMQGKDVSKETLAALQPITQMLEAL